MVLADEHRRVKGGYTYKSHKLYGRYGTVYGNYLAIIVFDFYFDNSDKSLTWKTIEHDIHRLLDKNGENCYRDFTDRELYKLYDEDNHCLIDTYLTIVRDYFLSHPIQSKIYLHGLQKRRITQGKVISKSL
jgi:hypothetical protein